MLDNGVARGNGGELGGYAGGDGSSEERGGGSGCCQENGGVDRRQRHVQAQAVHGVRAGSAGCVCMGTLWMGYWRGVARSAGMACCRVCVVCVYLRWVWAVSLSASKNRSRVTGRATLGPVFLSVQQPAPFSPTPMLCTHVRPTHTRTSFSLLHAPLLPPQVTLNVGGLRFTTSLSTLRNAPSPCLFNAMFRWGGVGWSGGTGEVGCGVWYMGPGPGESELSVPVIIQQERLRPLATPRVPRACPARRLPPLLLPCCAVLLRCSHGGLPAHVRPAAGGTS